MKTNSLTVSLIVTAALTLGLVLSPTRATAHPPKSVILTYDSAAGQLTVAITHTTSMPNRHYIKKVRISKNGKEISLNLYKNQPTQDTFTYSYPVAAAAGDVLEAKASCNIIGSRSASLTIAPPAGQ
ncbi:MAG: hypothetical protein WC881_03900 [Elusimicrobiota bacterium]|jgi:hypothetical protein